jgi:hypothetical protein
MSLQSAGSNTGDQYIKVGMWLQANAQDPVVTWANVALLYYFSPEEHGNFWCKHYGSVNGSNEESGAANRFLSRQVTPATNQEEFGVWTAIWRALPNNATAVPSNQEANLEIQVYNEPGNGLQNGDDHSYPTENPTAKQANSKIVICVRKNNQWVHAQGNPPAGVDQPCASVVDSCPNDAGLECDPLEWRQ